MSQEAEKRPLTLDDPVDHETLEQFRLLHEARQRFADSLLSLEQEKIQILAAVKKIDDQRNRLFEVCLVERGKHPGTKAEVNAKSGRITVEEESQPATPPATA